MMEVSDLLYARELMIRAHSLLGVAAKTWPGEAGSIEDLMSEIDDFLALDRAAGEERNG